MLEDMPSYIIDGTNGPNITSSHKSLNSLGESKDANTKRNNYFISNESKGNVCQVSEDRIIRWAL